MPPSSTILKSAQAPQNPSCYLSDAPGLDARRRMHCRGSPLPFLRVTARWQADLASDLFTRAPLKGLSLPGECQADRRTSGHIAWHTLASHQHQPEAGWSLIGCLNAAGPRTTGCSPLPYQRATLVSHGYACFAATVMVLAACNPLTRCQVHHFGSSTF